MALTALVCFEDCHLGLQLGHLLTVSSQDPPYMPAHPWCLFCVLISYSYKDTSHIQYGPP